MLSRFDFNSQMEQLAIAFGQPIGGKFKDQMGVFYEAIKDKLDDLSFRRTINYIRDNNDKFPTIKVLLELGRSFRPAVERKETMCMICGGSGCLTAKSDDGYRFVFKCKSCNNCKADYPVWDYQTGFQLA